MRQSRCRARSGVRQSVREAGRWLTAVDRLGRRRVRREAAEARSAVYVRGHVDHQSEAAYRKWLYAKQSETLRSLYEAAGVAYDAEGEVADAQA